MTDDSVIESDTDYVLPTGNMSLQDKINFVLC